MEKLFGVNKMNDLSKERTMKKKIRDLTSEEYREWKLKNCSDCLNCLFNYVNCKMWVNHKYMYSNKFLDQEVDIPSPHILDKQEHDYLRDVCKPYDVYKIAKLDCTSYYQITIFYNNPNDTYSTFYLPGFNKESSMYKGMKPDEHYTIEELELDKEWEE